MLALSTEYLASGVFWFSSSHNSGYKAMEGGEAVALCAPEPELW